VKKFIFKRAVFMTLVALILSAGILPYQAHAAPDKKIPPETFTVSIPGDSLSEIALRYCHRASLWPNIEKASGITDARHWIYLGKTVITVSCSDSAAVAPAMEATRVVAKPSEVVLNPPQVLPQKVAPAIPLPKTEKKIPAVSKWNKWWLTLPVLIVIIVGFSILSNRKVRTNNIVPPDGYPIPVVQPPSVVQPEAELVSTPASTMADNILPFATPTASPAPMLVNPDSWTLSKSASKESPTVRFVIEIPAGKIQAKAVFDPNVSFTKQLPKIFFLGGVNNDVEEYLCTMQDTDFEARYFLKERSASTPESNDTHHDIPASA
jgi:hypothetical protein